MKKLFITVCAALTGVLATAQTVRVEAPNLVSADEQFNVTFSVEGEHAASEFEWAPGDAFKLVWGPQKSTSTSISIVNGKRSKSVTNSYTYVLMPTRTGTFSLPGAVAVIQGKKVSSRAFNIEVVQARQGGASQGGAATQGSQSRQGTAKAAEAVSSDDIYMRLLVNKNRAVVGEAITATLKLYQRVSIGGFENASFPAFNGFWSQELAAPSNIEFKRENVGGEIFNTAVIRSWNLIPQKAGDFEIEPAELVCLVNVRASSSSGSIFDSFFQDSYRQVRKKVSTQPVTLHISPLPAGAPASFGGGVGKFEMKAELTRDSIKTHDAASLKVTVSGTGNLALLTAPKLSFPPDFEAYDVKSSDSGKSRVFEYPFIPRSHGEFEIGPVEYSYYDISAGRYVTLTSPPMHLSVARGPELEGAAPSGGQLVQNRRDVKDLGSDIRYISTRTPSFSPAGRFFVWSPLFWGLAAGLVLAAAVVWFVLRRRAERKADVALSRNRSATKMARKRLSVAGDFLSRNLYTAFYEELHKALLGFISDKLNMDAGDLSKDNISERLASEGVPGQVCEEFAALLDACEYARYAPDAGHEAMNSHYESAVSVISSIDSSMKKNNKKGAATAALVLLLMAAPFGAQAAGSYPDSLWNAGVAAYSEGHWDVAEGAWSAIAGLGCAGPELWCNLGDACFKQDKIAEAVLYYSRALKLDPSYSDARYNLEFVQAQTRDRIDSVPEFFLHSWLRKLCRALSSDAWGWIAIVLLGLALGMLLLFLLSGSPAGRRTGFFAGIISLILMILALIFANWQRRDFLRSDDAVVMRPVVSVKSAPAETGTKDLFILHEGATLQLVDSVGEWCNIRLSDGREGWLKAEQLEII